MAEDGDSVGGSEAIGDAQSVASPGSPAFDIKKIRGAGYPAIADAESLKSTWVNKLYDSGEAQAQDRYKQGTRNAMYMGGRQWLSWQKTRRAWEDLPLTSDDLRVTVNYVAVLVKTRVQRLISSEINWRGIPASNSFADRDQVNVAINLLKARWNATEVEQKLRLGLMQASATGLCALKSFWDPSIGPLTPATLFLPVPVMDPETGQPLSDQQGNPQMQMQEHYVGVDGRPVADASQAFMYRPGDTNTALRTVFNLRMNNDAHGWTEAEGFRWLIDEDIVPLAVCKEKFPAVADKMVAAKSSTAALTFERIVQASATARQQNVYSSSPYIGSQQNADQAPLGVIREYWEARSMFFPKGRLMVFAGGALAYDDEWPQGIFPYAPLFGEPAMMSPYGRPPINDMISPQNVVNREWTAIAKEQWSAGVGGWVAWAIPGIPDQLGKDDNQVLLVPQRTALANRPIGDVFKRLEPAVVSPDRWRLIEQAKAALFDVGSFHEVSRGQIPPGLDSGVAIQRLMENEVAPLKDTVESLKRSIIKWGRDQVAVARWGYGDSKRWLPVDRPDLGFQIETVSGEQLPDPETLQLDLEYFAPQSQAAVRAEVKELIAIQAITPAQGLKIMDLGAGFEEAYASHSRSYGKARLENLAIQKGEVMELPTSQVDPQTGQPLTTIMHIDPQTRMPTGEPLLFPDDDDLSVHLDVHHEILLDSTQPWDVRQMVLKHLNEHRRAAEQLAAEQAVKQGQIAAAAATPGAALQAATERHSARESAAAVSGG